MTEQIEQIERDGYAIFRNFLDTATIDQIRSYMDSMLPPLQPPDLAGLNRVQCLRHPLPGPLMADILSNPDLIGLATNLLSAENLKLLEQVLMRTDPVNTGLDPAGATGWHIDMAFLPEHYQARPRQTYYHMVHVLNDVGPGGGGTYIVPGSHHQTYAAAGLLGADRLAELRSNPAEVAGVDLSEAVEAKPQAGDLLVFNPMCLHSASTNTSGKPRYVYFASFFDGSAKDLLSFLHATNQRTFPDSLRDGLPAQLRSLLTDELQVVARV